MSGESLLLLVLASEMTPMQVDVFIDNVVLGRSMLVLAEEYGCSRENIGNVSQRARWRAQRVLTPELMAA